MPTAKKPRNKGITYKLVPRSYGDANGDQGPVWVSEADFYRNHQNAAPLEEEAKAEQQFNMYAAAADAEFKEQQRPRRRRTEDVDEDDAELVGEEGEFYGAEEEGEWVDGDWDEEGEWDEEDWEEESEEAQPPRPAPKAASAAAAASAMPPAAAAKRVSFAAPATTTAARMAAPPPPPPAASASAVAGRLQGREEKRVRADDDDAADPREEGDRDVDEKEGEEEDEKLFEDEVDCEVTDDFLRQLVFGSGGGAGDEGGDDDSMFDDEEGEEDEWDGLDQEDSEMWRLLTDEEKAAIKATRQRGTARRRKVTAGGAGADGVSRTHAADGTEYPTHDVTQRALDRQFTEMMREFNADARLNDAYTDDPRTHGALSMDKYMAALEEFVTDRAGMDTETAAPHKNKGLIQQLRYLSHHVGAFDSDAHGTFMTTMLPEKQQRFIEEFVKGTEEIRRAARQRMVQRQQQQAAAAAATAAATAAEANNAEEEDEKEEMIVVEVKPKVDRLDCETAVSAYSTYYNQPNIIQAPRRQKKTVGVVKGNVISAGDDAATAEASGKRGKKQQQQRVSSSDEDEESGSEEEGNRAAELIPTVRPKGETKEEKKLRRQAVKAAQRERRQAKSALKSMYKDVESEEVKRSATSQAARRTVHFM